MPHPFRFAVQTFSATSASEWCDRARHVEALGYSSLHLADHIIGPGEVIAAANHPIQELAAVPAMAAAAAATQTLKIGCRVFCVDYRHPAVLAKETATLDLLSDGRLEIGLGAGWLKGEYEALGIAFDKPSVRIARLTEVVSLLKAHFAGGPIDEQGEHVTVNGYSGVPAPVQKPHPPIMIGGGSKRILTLAGKEADIVSFNFNNRAGILGPDGVMNSTEEKTQEKLGWVREAAGARFDEIEFEIGAYFTFIGDNADAAAGGMAKAFGLTDSQMRSHPHGLFGSVDEVCDELVRRREIFGTNYITVPDTAIDAFAPVVAKLAGS
ncbi:MAG: putative F420-dependent oxidoreductase [Myxococcota bacterium]|jgi:probable F420-dependent oxidoreductase